MPCAIVDRDRFVLASNGDIDNEVGQQLSDKSDGVGSPEWTIQTLDRQEGLSLALGSWSKEKHGVMRRFFESSNLLFAVIDFDGTCLEANEAWLNVLGYRPDELIGTNAIELIEPNGYQDSIKRVRQELASTGRTTATYQLRSKSGEYRSVEWTITGDGSSGRVFNIGRDITEEKEVERRLRDSDRFFSLARDYLLVFGRGGEIVRVNEALRAGFRLSEEEILELHAASLIHPDDLQAAGEATAAAIEHGEATWTGRVLAYDGCHSLQCTLVHDSEEDVIVVVARDVSEEIRLNQALRLRAERDPLTGLANRHTITGLIDSALIQGRPAVLFCDLDRFKVVNDSLGHRIGDDLLRTLGRRLESIDAEPGVQVGRIGGDEFVVLIEDSDEAEARAMAERLIELVSSAFALRGKKVFVGLSIGVALASDWMREASNDESGDLLAAADTAVYRAKADGGGRIVVFDEALQQRARNRMAVEVELRSALDESRVYAHAQPTMRMEDGAIVGAELLVRLVRHNGDVLPPDEFLWVAEETGLLPAMDVRMINTAFGYFSELLPGLSASVNVSAGQIVDPDFPDLVAKVAADNNRTLDGLIVELTESSVLLDTTVATQNLVRLRSMGAKIALDDFGTGFSSLSHLRSLPIDILKIDREFTQTFLEDPSTLSIIQGLLSICMGLGIEVTAEGVESEEQAQALQALGCQTAQGWLYHPAMPIEDLARIRGQRLPQEVVAQSDKSRRLWQPDRQH